MIQPLGGGPTVDPNAITAPNPHAPPDIFLSYSRKNDKAAEALAAALEQKDLRVWIDRRSIPVGSRWWIEILEAIDLSAMFGFLITADSLHSDHCRAELAHAVSHGKRIVPILGENIPPERWPPELAAWESCDLTAGPTETDVHRLVEAVRSDLAVSKFQAELQGQINRWADGRGDLARGRFLLDAQRWLADQKGPKPRPTDEQASFVAQSARAETKRQRRTAALLSTGLIVTAILAIVAILLYLNSESRRVQSLSRQLAAQAGSVELRELDLAALLAVEAFDVSPTNEARSALLRVVTRSPRLLTHLHGAPVSPGSIGIDAAGRWVAVAGSTDQITVWDLRTGQVQSTLSLLEPSDDASKQRPATVVWHPTLERLVAGDWDGRVAVWDFEGPEPHRVITLNDLGMIECFAWSSDEKVLVAGTLDGKVLLGSLQGSALTFPRNTPLESSPVIAVAFVGASKLVACGLQNGHVIFVDTGSGRVVGAPLVGNRQRLLGMSIDAAGQKLLTSGFDGHLVAWDMDRTPVTPHEIGVENDRVTSLVMNGTGTLAATGLYGGGITLWDVREGHPVEASLTAHRQRVTGLALTPDATTLVSVSNDGVVLIWDVRPLDARDPRLPAHGRSEVADVFLDASGRRAASVDVGGRLLLHDAVSPHAFTTRALAFDENVERVRIDRDQGRIVTVTDVGVVAWRDVDGHVLSRAHPKEGSLDVSGFSVDPTSGRIALGTTSGRILTALRGDPELHELGPPSQEAVMALTVERGGERIVAATGRRLRVFDHEGKSWVEFQLPAASGNVYCLAREPGGSGLAAVDDSGRLTTYDLSTRRVRLAPVQGSASRVFGVAWSSQGLIATGDDDGEVTLWDASTLQAVGSPLPLHLGFATSVAFSGDGQTLASGGADGRVGLWDVDVRSWQRRACQLAGRQLRADEWNRNLPGETPTDLCRDRLEGGSPGVLPSGLPKRVDAGEKLKDENGARAVASTSGFHHDRGACDSRWLNASSIGRRWSGVAARASMSRLACFHVDSWEPTSSGAMLTASI